MGPEQDRSSKRMAIMGNRTSRYRDTNRAWLLGVNNGQVHAVFKDKDGLRLALVASVALSVEAEVGTEN